MKKEEYIEENVKAYESEEKTKRKKIKYFYILCSCSYMHLSESNCSGRTDL
jgi:hypothetical protein